jgi:zinc protease
LSKARPVVPPSKLASQIESIGGHLDTYAGNNSFGISAEVLGDDFATGLDLVSDVLLHTGFPRPGFELERQIQFAALRAQRDDLLASANRLMRRTLFGDAGYGLMPHGTEAGLQSLKVSDLKALHQKLVVPQNCVLAIYGDINAAKVERAVQARFGAWKAGPLTATRDRLPSKSSPGPRLPNRAVEFREKKQTVLILGFPGTTMEHPDRFALELLQEACSDMGSRLFLRIRENLGLAYYVGAQHFPGLVPGYFSFLCRHRSRPRPS